MNTNCKIGESNEATLQPLQINLIKLLENCYLVT